MAPPGEHLDEALPDRYRIERELGQGGMAGRTVAEATASAVEPRSVNKTERDA